jgi:hypothetical protein
MRDSKRIELLHGTLDVEDQAARWRRLSALVNKLLLDEG